MNPSKQIRLTHNISQIQLANHAGVTRQTILDTEAGLYSKIPPSLLSKLSLLSRVSPQDIEALYAKYVRDTRRANAREFAVDVRDVENFLDYCYKVGGSVKGFCRVLVIQHSAVRSYVSQGLRWGMIDAAMTEAGVPGDFIDWLSKLPPSPTQETRARRTGRQYKRPA